MNKASEIFWDAFVDGGSIATECSCGRTHFSYSEDNDWEENELEELLEKQKEYPDKYIGTEDDCVAVAMIQGNPVCYNCPCNIAAKYENFILQHETEIIKYFKIKASKEWAKATKSQSEFQSLELFK